MRRPSALMLLLVLVATASQAEEKPLWEYGLGAGGIMFPDYRGSDHTQFYPVPVPYIVYRGKFLKSDRDGIRGQFFNKKYAELSFSGSGSVPVDSDESAARQGMPDLKPTLEFGPSLDLHLWAAEDMKLDLILPVRAPITLESSPQFIGLVFAPRIHIDIDNVAGLDGWDFGAGVGPLFATNKYHDYFYSVAPRYATPERPVYDADGGYSGMHMLLSLSKRFPKYWVGAYLRADALHGAAFDNSPLIEQKYALSGGIGIAWMIGKSERTVDVEE